jgi:hypothetical protein
VLHVFRFDLTAIAVPAEGQRLGTRYKRGAWTCVMCRALLAFVVRFDQDHGDDCPGWVEKAKGYLDK